jgi:hypothetical protein
VNLINKFNQMNLDYEDWSWRLNEFEEKVEIWSLKDDEEEWICSLKVKSENKFEG